MNNDGRLPIIHVPYLLTTAGSYLLAASCRFLASTITMELRSSETSVDCHPDTRRHIPEIRFFMVTALRTTNSSSSTLIFKGR